MQRYWEYARRLRRFVGTSAYALLLMYYCLCTNPYIHIFINFGEL